MTLEEFRAGKQWCENLGKALDDGDLEYVCGWLYGPQHTYFIDQTDRRHFDGRWHLILDRSEWVTDDLADLEEALYYWVAHEYGWR